MRKILLLLMFALSITAYAKDMISVKSNGGEASWAISTVNEISFDGEGVKISFNDGKDVYYSCEMFNMLQFNATPTGVSSVNGENAIAIKGNTIVAKSAIKVYALNGNLVAQSAGNSLDISNLSSGSYIVKAGKSITKIVKK